MAIGSCHLSNFCCLIRINTIKGKHVKLLALNTVNEYTKIKE